jgi:hypothetical protein
MALQKKPIYVFENPNEYGIHLVPLNRLVLVESTHRLYFLKNNTGLSAQNTVQDAINAGKLVMFWSNENDGPYSGLEAQSSTYWNGYRLINVSTNEPHASDGHNGDIWFQRDA